MRHLHNINIEVEAKTKDVLEILRRNRTAHRKIVQEARAGWLKRCRAELEKRLQEITEGNDGCLVMLKAPKSFNMHFQLPEPQDHTAEYDTVIQSLEMHTGETITLDADAVRQLVENRWDWIEEFLARNSAYSETADRLRY
jgi:hypothetical protein